MCDRFWFWFYLWFCPSPQCHSDLHTLDGEWGAFEQPVVAGHELLGIVTAVGPQAKKFAVGDRVGVGPQALSCQSCSTCSAGNTTYCRQGFIGTYKAQLPSGRVSMGGYAKYNRTHEDFVFRCVTRRVTVCVRLFVN